MVCINSREEKKRQINDVMEKATREKRATLLSEVKAEGIVKKGK
jgi:hypothetical protein